MGQRYYSKSTGSTTGMRIAKVDSENRFSEFLGEIKKPTFRSECAKGGIEQSTLLE